MGSGGGQQQSTTTPVIPKWLRGDVQQIAGGLMSNLFPNGQMQQYNQGLNQQTAGFSPMQLEAQQGAQGAFGGAQQTVSDAQKASQTLTDPNLLYAQSNPY